ncbi:hypothetical protein [Loigolactobacillus bifermentans]|uniref:hypothetical protein n=1 Tax=Loigolactobacillus bifermentans TaxID=1607 RepID=UPI00070D9CE1|nr:hypothetical protein [Loigolactobacillus bifermentans]QGG59605.1 hypothetical protein LB003_03415 [Loigolactobacillus bifermentans]
MVILDITASSHFGLMKSMNPNLVKEKIYRIPDLADIILTTERYKGKLYWHASLTDHTGEGPVPENFGIKLMETRIFEDWMKENVYTSCF